MISKKKDNCNVFFDTVPGSSNMRYFKLQELGLQHGNDE
jgi:hypothetical protein